MAAIVPGTIFGMLTVRCPDESVPSGTGIKKAFHATSLCDCACGNTKIIRNAQLNRGRSSVPNCGCMTKQLQCQSLKRGQQHRSQKPSKNPCICGASKRIRSRLCPKCWHEQQRQQQAPKLICECGGPKNIKANYCKDCYQAKTNKMTADGSVICLKCGPLPANKFYISKLGKYRALCKACCKVAGRESNIRSKCKRYGMPSELTERIIAAGHYACEICDKTIKQFHVDHCHKTGKFRGILCSNCNSGIGMLKDDVNVLRKAIDYLLRNTV